MAGKSRTSMAGCPHLQVWKTMVNGVEVSKCQMCPATWIGDEKPKSRTNKNQEISTGEEQVIHKSILFVCVNGDKNTAIRLGRKIGVPQKDIIDLYDKEQKNTSISSDA